MQLESRAPGYWLVHNVVTPTGLQISSSLDTFSSSSIGDPVVHPIADGEHPLLCLLGPDIASQKTAISRSLQQNLASICNSVWVWWLIMGWVPGWGILCIVHPFVLAPNFVSVTPFMGIVFLILRRNEVSTHWSYLLLIFLFYKLYLGYSMLLG